MVEKNLAPIAGLQLISYENPQELPEYDLLVNIVPQRKRQELLEAIAAVKKHFPFLGAPDSPNDLIVQLIAYKGVFEHFAPRNHPRPIIIIQRMVPTAEWVLKYQNYIVWEPHTHVISRVIKTAQHPMQGAPYLTLAISSLRLNKYGLPSLEQTHERFSISDPDSN